MKNNLQYFVADPGSSQARVIAKFIDRYLPQCEVIGLLDGVGVVRRWMKPYRKMVGSEVLISPEACIVPTGAHSTAQMLRHRDVTIGKITMRQASLDVYQKPWMIEMAAAAGVPVPNTHLTLGPEVSFPLFYKQREERGGGVSGVARQVSEVPTEGREELIYQEYIASQGTYGVGFIADSGELLTTFTHFERESMPAAGGSAVIIERFDDERLVAYTKRIVDRIKYSGWGLAEFKYCPVRDDYVFMEINAKFWASCEFAFINQPEFLRLLFGIEVDEPKVDRMVFIDRALKRGLLFVFINFAILRHAEAYRMYADGLPGIAVGLLPAPIRKFFKRTNVSLRQIFLLVNRCKY